MKQFILQMVGSEADWEANSPEEMQEIIDAMGVYNRSLVEAGALVDGAGLDPPSEARTVTFDENNETTVSDGPLGGGKEHLAGYWVIAADSLEDAIEWTRKAPVRGGKIEVRAMLGYGEPVTIEEFESKSELAEKELKEAIAEREG